MSTNTENSVLAAAKNTYRHEKGAINSNFLVFALMTNTELIKEEPPKPTSLTEAMSSPDSSSWRAAMAEEAATLQEIPTWKLVPRPTSTNVMGCCWVFRIKHDTQQLIMKYKAHLVVQGFSQIPGCDFGNTFSPVAKTPSRHKLLALPHTQ